jgi:hypothetical protein
MNADASKENYIQRAVLGKAEKRTASTVALLPRPGTASRIESFLA